MGEGVGVIGPGHLGPAGVVEWGASRGVGLTNTRRIALTSVAAGLAGWSEQPGRELTFIAKSSCLL